MCNFSNSIWVVAEDILILPDRVKRTNLFINNIFVKQSGWVKTFVQRIFIINFSVLFYDMDRTLTN